ncbi:MAG: glycosyltransferase [Planctomycetaceae bacterium]
MFRSRTRQSLEVFLYVIQSLANSATLKLSFDKALVCATGFASVFVSCKALAEPVLIKPGRDRALVPVVGTEVMDVTHIQRLPPKGRFSIEAYFSRIRECLEESVDVKLFVLPHESRGIWPRIQNMLAARREQCDVSHVTGDVNYVTLFLQRKRTVLTVLDCEVMDRNTGWKRLLLKWLWFILPSRRVAAITVISEETKRNLIRVTGLPSDRIQVLPVPVKAMFSASPHSFNVVCPRILHIGTKANKNLPRLIEALRTVQCRLDIVGPIDEAQQDALDEHGIPHENFLQLTDEELLERYHEADIVSFVSTYEGFGLPIVEAQSVERICITSSCSSMPEVAGEGACFVDPFDVGSIRRGLDKVIRDVDYRESIIAAGRKNRLRFDAQRIADAFQQLYQDIDKAASK